MQKKKAEHISHTGGGCKQGWSLGGVKNCQKKLKKNQNEKNGNFLFFLTFPFFGTLMCAKKFGVKPRGRI